MRTEVNRNIWMLADDSPSFSQPLKLALPSAPTLRLRAHFIWFTVPLRATHCWFSKRDQSGSWLNGAVGYCRRLSDLEPEHIWGAVQLFTLSTLSVQIHMQAKSNLGTLDFDIKSIRFFCYTNCIYSLSPCFQRQDPEKPPGWYLLDSRMDV